MNRSFRMQLALGILATPVLQAHHSLQEQPARHLAIVISDQAELSSKMIAEMQAEAGRVLAGAGIEVAWQQIPSNAPEAHEEDLSAQTGPVVSPDARGYLLVRIVKGWPARIRQGFLGYSLPDGRSGVQATVFYDRVEPLGQANGISIAALLANVLAHEIGHVLLGKTEHSPEGIMKARWGKADYQKAAMGFLSFATAEREIVLRRLSVESTSN